MHDPPETDAGPRRTTEWIAALYGRVLGVDGVGADDDFFLLGGTSFTAMRLLDAIAEVVGVEVPVRSFYRATGVAELARAVDALIADAGVE